MRKLYNQIFYVTIMSHSQRRIQER